MNKNEVREAMMGFVLAFGSGDSKDNILFSKWYTEVSYSLYGLRMRGYLSGSNYITVTQKGLDLIRGDEDE